MNILRYISKSLIYQFQTNNHLLKISKRKKIYIYVITFSFISTVVSRSFIRFSLFSSWSFDDFSCIIRRLADFLANKAFLMAWGEVIESSKSNLSRPRRRGAGLEVSGRPVLKINIFLINICNLFFSILVKKSKFVC